MQQIPTSANDLDGDITISHVSTDPQSPLYTCIKTILNHFVLVCFCVVCEGDQLMGEACCKSLFSSTVALTLGAQRHGGYIGGMREL